MKRTNERWMAAAVEAGAKTPGWVLAMNWPGLTRAKTRDDAEGKIWREMKSWGLV